MILPSLDTTSSEYGHRRKYTHGSLLSVLLSTVTLDPTQELRTPVTWPTL